MPTGASTGTRACAQVRRTWRALALAVLLLAAALVAHAPAALALKAIEINNDRRPHRDNRTGRGL